MELNTRSPKKILAELTRSKITLFLISEGDEQLQFNFPPDEFTSKKITTKILQQIEVIYLVQS